MASFLTTSGTSYHIERIMIDAKKELVLISPYLKLSTTFFERLQDATKKGILVKIIYGKDELKPQEEKQIKALENIELYFSKNLHAKCYFNESEMVITSMNMYEFSEKNNREMGVHITMEQDKLVYENAVDEARSIQNNSEIRHKSGNLQTPNKSNQPTNNSFPFKTKGNPGFINMGGCIRCGETLPFNPFQPMCSKCFKTWSQFGNVDYIVHFCHKCNEEADTSISKPLCPDCFSGMPWETKQKLMSSYKGAF